MAPTAPRRRRRSISVSEFLIGALIGVCGVIVMFVVFWPAEKPLPPPPPAPVKHVSLPKPPPPPPPVPQDLLTRATLIGPDSVLAGGVLSVRWTGPDNPDDFVTLVKPDAPDTEYAENQATKTGRILEFTVPEETGPYELRYIAGRARQILGRSPVTVMPLTAEISAPGQAVLGTSITVNWTGPNRPGDFLTIVPPEASEEVFESVTAVDQGSPVTMQVPVDPGDVEIRYLSKSHKVLGRKTINITIPVTTLFAPDQVTAGNAIEVSWHGPDSPHDSITLVSRGAPDGKYGRSTPTSKGSPLTIRAPKHAGKMELRYMTGSGSKSLVLSRRPIVIKP